MRSFIVAMLIGAVIVISSIIYTNHLDKVSAQLIKKNDEITQLVIEENYSGATRAIDELEEILEKNRVLLAATGNHEELLKIELAYRELREYTQNEQLADAAAQCSGLDVLLKHMPSNYKIKAENIL